MLIFTSSKFCSLGIYYFIIQRNEIEINKIQEKTKIKRSQFGAKTWLLQVEKKSVGIPPWLSVTDGGLAYKECRPAVLHPKTEKKRKWVLTAGGGL